MRRGLRSLIPIAAVTGLVLAGGFFVFARKVAALAPEGRPVADAVVVLTGGEDRIAAGVGLVANEQGRRLLISGVNPLHASPVELARRIGGSEAVFRCCVDLGYGALDTIGNAIEARKWAERWGFRSLIIVTSGYHMPRSLAEFMRAMPGVALYAHPVASRHYRVSVWWRHFPTARLLAAEYVKFLASTAKLQFARLAGRLDAPSVAASRPVARTDRN